jgi:pilus assembly protein CpaB
VRVLAIDQAPKEKDGQNAVVGKTVTLELKPEQAETLARARQTGTLALALRSIADLNAVEPTTDDQASKRGDIVNVVRYGVSSPTTTQR